MCVCAACRRSVHSQDSSIYSWRISSAWQTPACPPNALHLLSSGWTAGTDGKLGISEVHKARPWLARKRSMAAPLHAVNPRMFWVTGAIIPLMTELNARAWWEAAAVFRSSSWNVRKKNWWMALLLFIVGWPWMSWCPTFRTSCTFSLENW